VVNLASATQSITSSNSLISGITLSDVDAGISPVVVTLKVNSGTLNVATTPNVTIATNNTGTVTLTGTIANINTALANLRYSSSNNFSGNDSLNITVNDQGNTGSEGAKSDSKAIALNVSRDLGSLPIPQLISGSVNVTDPVDVYQVTFTSPVTLSATLSVLSGDADLAILDSSGNAIATSNNAGLIAEFLQRQLAAGTYRIQVRRFTGATNYNLLLSKF
jgi:large repetitive protein